jgi:hypothetical protein
LPAAHTAAICYGDIQRPKVRGKERASFPDSAGNTREDGQTARSGSEKKNKKNRTKTLK